VFPDAHHGWTLQLMGCPSQCTVLPFKHAKFLYFILEYHSLSVGQPTVFSDKCTVLLNFNAMITQKFLGRVTFLFLLSWRWS